MPTLCRFAFNDDDSVRDGSFFWKGVVCLLYRPNNRQCAIETILEVDSGFRGSETGGRVDTPDA